MLKFMSLRIRLCFPFSFASYLQKCNYHIGSIYIESIIEKNRKSKGKGGAGVEGHPGPKLLFSGTTRTIHNCHCYTRPPLTTFHTLPICIALPAPSSSCCHLTMKIKVLQFLQCKGHGVLLLIYSEPFFFRFWATTIILTCFGMQIGRILSVNVISRSRIYIAKSCDSKSLLLKW